MNLKPGDWVEVLSQDEILASLDESGRLENLPFMPEMLQYCGKRFRVYKRSDKTCQYKVGWTIRRMENTVFLEGLRCDGSGHDGCEAGCLIFWKEAWLKRIDNDVVDANVLRRQRPASALSCTVEQLLAASRRTNEQGEPVYSCQETDVNEFSFPMKMWDPRQYIRDLRSGNLSTGLGDGSREQRWLDSLLSVYKILGAVTISMFNRVQQSRHGTSYPHIAGELEKTPLEELNLQPGELVQVRSKEEIIATLNKQNRNRGLLFDWEMLTYCGGIYRVLRRVHHIVDDKTGKMLHMKNPCIVLEGVVCRSDYHRLCPRAIYHYWREGWLRRALDIPDALRQQEQLKETCQTS